jgi:acyl carrier protein
MFSSAATILGTPGTANYAAANSFMAALAYHRHSQGLPATTIDWCAWTVSGTAMKRDILGDVSALGITQLSPDQGLKLLNRILRSGAQRVLVFPALSKALSTDTSELEGAGPRESTSQDASRQPINADEIAKGLVETTGQPQKDMLRTFIESCLCRILGLDSSLSIRGDQPFTELGIDSLMALELRNDLQRALRASLPSTLLFQYPTLDSVLTYCLAMLAANPDSNSQSSTEYEQITI